MSDDGWVSPECFRAYVNAEIKIPNTLTAVGPYVGHAALAPLAAADALTPAVRRFAETFTFNDNQFKRATKTVVLIHRRFGIPVLPEGVDFRGDEGVRVFGLPRFEVVYSEGVMNIMEAILRLHGERGTIGESRVPQVAELLGRPDALAATVAAFAVAEAAIDSDEATQLSELFKEQFNFAASGDRPRAMAPEEKDKIQAEVTPFLVTAVTKTLADSVIDASPERVADFVRILTSPELHVEAA